MNTRETILIGRLLEHLGTSYYLMGEKLGEAVNQDVKEVANRWSDLDFRVTAESLANAALTLEELRDHLDISP